MTRKPKPPTDDPEQAKRFIAMAREIGAAETEEEADAALRKVVRPTPAAAKKPVKASRPS